MIISLTEDKQKLDLRTTVTSNLKGNHCFCLSCKVPSLKYHSKFCFCYLENMLKDRLSKTSGWQFPKWLLGPEKLSGRSRNAPGQRFLTPLTGKISLTSSIVINVPTRATLGVETKGLLFLWLTKAMFVNRYLSH